MPWAIEIAFSNTLVAAAAAVFVTVLARYLNRRPAITHAMWMVVLIKLVTPPLFSIPVAMDWNATPLAAVNSDMAEPEFSNAQTLALAKAELERLQAGSDSPDTWAPTAWRLCITAWLIGTVCLAALSILRILRFSSLLRATQSCEARMTTIVNRTAHQFGLKESPPIIVVDSRIPPLVWHTGRRAKIVLPKQLVSNASEEQLVLLLAHEMAHIQRGDHLVRWFTLLVLALNWWNPVAWWAVHQLRDAEEQCCDAMVVANSACNGHVYAETLLETLDFLAAGATLPPQLASGINSGGSMKKRFEMIINGQSSFRVGKLAGALLLLLAATVLAPSIVRADDDESVDHDQRIAKLQELVEKLSLELELVKKERSLNQANATSVDYPSLGAVELTRKGNALTLTLDAKEDTKSQDVQKLIKQIRVREGHKLGELSVVVPEKTETHKIDSLTIYGDLLEEGDLLLFKNDLPKAKAVDEALHIKADVKNKRAKEAKLKEEKEKMAKQEKAMWKLKQQLEEKRKETLELQRRMEMMQLQMM